MKYFLMGLIVALIILWWISLAVTGAISIEIAIGIPAALVAGVGLACVLFGLWWNH